MKKKLFFSNDSVGDVGSSCASINRTGKNNAKKGPQVDYNEYKDFHDREIEAHIIAAFIKFAGMSSVRGLNIIFSISNIYKLPNPTNTIISVADPDLACL